MSTCIRKWLLLGWQYICQQKQRKKVYFLEQMWGHSTVDITCMVQTCLLLEMSSCDFAFKIQTKVASVIFLYSDPMSTPSSLLFTKGIHFTRNGISFCLKTEWLGKKISTLHCLICSFFLLIWLRIGGRKKFFIFFPDCYYHMISIYFAQWARIMDEKLHVEMMKWYTYYIERF